MSALSPLESPLIGYAMLKRWASEWALGDGGPVCVVGALPAALLPAIAASASDVVLVGNTGELEPAARSLGSYSPVAVTVDSAEEGIPEIEGGYRRLLVTDLGDEESTALDRLDEALGACVDGAEIYLCCSWPTELRRIEKLLRAHCHSTLERPIDAPSEWCVYQGVRKSTQAVEAVEEEGGVLDVTAIVIADVEHAGTEGMLLDLLLRQHHPASDVIVLDRAEEESNRLPEELFGFPAHSLSAVALVSGTDAGASLGGLLNETLSVVSTSYVVILSKDWRLAPHHLGALMLQLEHAPNAVAAVGHHLNPGPREGLVDTSILFPGPHPLRTFLHHGAPSQGCVMLRMDALRAVNGFDPEVSDDSAVLWTDLWLRLLLHGSVALCPLPLVAAHWLKLSGRPDPSAIGSITGQLATRLLTKLAREERESAREHRELVARARLARAILNGFNDEHLAKAGDLVEQASRMALAARTPAALAKCPAPPQALYDALYWMICCLSPSHSDAPDELAEVAPLLKEAASPEVLALLAAKAAISGREEDPTEAMWRELREALMPYEIRGCDVSCQLMGFSPEVMGFHCESPSPTSRLSGTRSWLIGMQVIPPWVRWPNSPWS